MSGRWGGEEVDIRMWHVCVCVYVYVYVAVTGRKRHSKWVNSTQKCFIEITPDFLCPFMND